MKFAASMGAIFDPCESLSVLADYLDEAGHEEPACMCEVIRWLASTAHLIQATENPLLSESSVLHGPSTPNVLNPWIENGIRCLDEARPYVNELAVSLVEAIAAYVITGPTGNYAEQEEYETFLTLLVQYALLNL